jgi:hypothetical protein
MADASALVEEARKAAGPVAEKLRAHPYIDAIEQGTLPHAELRRFAGEQWHIIASDLRSVAHLLSRYGVGRTRAFFLDVLEGERAALAAIEPLARVAGARIETLPDYEPMAGAHAYTCYMAWLGLYGSAGEVAAAYVVNFPTWGESCGRISRGLQAKYGFSAADVLFFDQFAAPAQGFEAAALGVIQEDLDRGGDPTGVLRAVRLLQAYELLYWDSLWGAADGGPEATPLP